MNVEANESRRAVITIRKSWISSSTVRSASSVNVPVWEAEPAIGHAMAIHCLQVCMDGQTVTRNARLQRFVNIDGPMFLCRFVQNLFNQRWGGDP